MIERIDRCRAEMPCILLMKYDNWCDIIGCANNRENLNFAVRSSNTGG